MEFLKLLTWENINVSEGRRNLGEDMPVAVYRLMQYAIHDELAERYSLEEAQSIIRDSGHRVGIVFFNQLFDRALPFNEFISELQRTLKEFKIGVLRVEKSEPEQGKFVLTVAEDLDCSGLPILNETVCYYDEGFISGILEAYTGNKFNVVEIDCWATGDRVCRFTAEVI
jgi:Predicted hydrocarbon binding protein (contains V4R domain)